MFRRVIVDTSAIYALISASDNFHQKARHTYEGIIDSGTELYTTSYILVETVALVHHRLGFQPLKTFMESIQGIFNTFWINQAIHTQAWKLMVARESKRLSLVDCTTVIVAKELDALIFAFDEDLAKEAVGVIP